VSAAATVTDVLAGNARWCVVEGDCAEVLRSLPDGCADAVVSDPPSGIAFMGAEWDRNKGGRSQWVAWLAGILSDARRATRDGGRAIVWSLPRTSHWTGCAVEDAGWSIETTIAHLFGTGWPKGKAQTKPAQETWWLARTGKSEALNVEACRVGTSKPATTRGAGGQHGAYGAIGAQGRVDGDTGRYPPNLLLSHATGCVCEGTRRVATGTGYKPADANYTRGPSAVPFTLRRDGTTCYVSPDGTEPVEAWACVEGCPVAELGAQSEELTSNAVGKPTPRGLGYGGGAGSTLQPRPKDTGTAARFFPQFPADAPDAPWSEALFQYVAKPSRAERNVGLVEPGPRRKRNELLPGDCYGNDRREGNTHPTVKSVALMRWLLRLVTKPRDVILDPFGGSGTTGVAALLEGRRVILVEREPQYAAIARARCAAADGSVWTAPVVARPREAKPQDERQPSLFAGGA
jgi:site-specific DNA-methyltransferase (adenine-specific)